MDTRGRAHALSAAWTARALTTLVALTPLPGCGRVGFQRELEPDGGACANCLDAGPPRDAMADVIIVPSSDAGGADSSTDGGSSPSSLIAHWPLDDGAGSSVVDASGGGLTGTVVSDGNAAWVAGRFGSALDIVDCHVTVPDTPALERIAANNALTITAWVRVASITEQFRPIVSRQESTSASEHFGLYLDLTRNAVWGLVTDDGGLGECRAAQDTPVGRWFHTAMTWDGATVVVYLDGLEGCRASASVRLRNDDTLLGLGVNYNGDRPPGGYTEGLGGDLDEIAIYDRALTAAEIGRIARGEVFVLP